jgi:hypothetical protein
MPAGVPIGRGGAGKADAAIGIGGRVEPLKRRADVAVIAGQTMEPGGFRVEKDIRRSALDEGKDVGGVPPMDGFDFSAGMQLLEP